MIAVALFCLWLVFNGQVTWELIILGLLISSGLAWFVQKFIAPEFTLRRQFIFAKNFPAYLRFAWLLIKEITLANFAVMRLILTDKDVVVPKLATFRSKLDSKAAQVVLADCITLTPGTITVHMEDNDYLVHCLDEELEAGLIDSEFEKHLLRFEELWRKDMAK